MPRRAPGPHHVLTHPLAIHEQGGVWMAVPGDFWEVLFIAQETHLRLPASDFVGGDSCFENKASTQADILAL